MHNMTKKILSIILSAFVFAAAVLTYPAAGGPDDISSDPEAAVEEYSEISVQEPDPNEEEQNLQEIPDEEAEGSPAPFREEEDALPETADEASEILSGLQQDLCAQEELSDMTQEAPEELFEEQNPEITQDPQDANETDPEGQEPAQYAQEEFSEEPNPEITQDPQDANEADPEGQEPAQDSQEEFSEEPNPEITQDPQEPDEADPAGQEPALNPQALQQTAPESPELTLIPKEPDAPRDPDIKQEPDSSEAADVTGQPNSEDPRNPKQNPDPGEEPETEETPSEEESTEEEQEKEQEQEDPYYLGDWCDYSWFGGVNLSSMRLIVGTYDESIFVDDGSLLSGYNGVYLLQYQSEEDALKAYAYYYYMADFVEADAGIMIAEGEAAETVETGSVMTEEENPLSELEAAVYEAGYDSFDIALIDTGSDGADESVSMIGEYVWDDNGHGTAMTGYIRILAPEARILSIKALGADGKGDVSAVYAAIQYAMERGVKIINMSISALSGADSFVIEQAVNEAVSMGIHVTGAAGNNARNAGYYIPGGIDAAMIIGSCDAEGEKTGFSNYGPTVDYAVISDSTSEAAARFSGWLFQNGTERITEGFREGFLFPADGTSESELPEEEDGMFTTATRAPVDESGPYQNLSGKLYSYADADHPLPATSIYSTGKDYRDIATIQIHNDRFYYYTNEQGLIFVGIDQDDVGYSWFYSYATKYKLLVDIEAGPAHYTAGTVLSLDELRRLYSMGAIDPRDTSGVLEEVTEKEYWLDAEHSATDPDRPYLHVEPSAVFYNPFSIILHGAAADVFGNELDLTVNFDKVQIFKDTFAGLGANYPDNWGYTTPAAYDGTIWIATILEDCMWSDSVPGYAPGSDRRSVWPGGLNTITMSWTYSDGTPYTGNVDYAFYDIDSGQSGGHPFLWATEAKPSYMDLQETVSLNSGWTGVYKMVPDSQWKLTAINNNASYLCGAADEDTFRSGFVATASQSATLTWGGNWCGTIFYYIFNDSQGALRVEKKSSDPSFHKSLAGAVYGIYTDRSCTDNSKVDEITTDADGIAATNGYCLAAGTYYVKELAAPEGYGLSTEISGVSVQDGKTAVVSVVDDPESKGSVQIRKEIDTSGLSAACISALKSSSEYSVAGAQYTVYTDSACTSRYGSEVLTIRADDGTGMTGSSNIITDVPQGTYYIKETKAGTGLLLDPSVYSVTITGANHSQTQLPKTRSKDVPVLGSITLTKSSSAAQITANNSAYSLQGAKYGIYTDSSCSTLYMEAVTDANGTFQITQMPLGTYYIRELEASKGFSAAPCAAGGTAQVHQVKLSKTSPEASVECKEPAMAAPFHLLVQKKDARSGRSTAQGNASFEGAEYTVRYYMNPDFRGNPARTWTFVMNADGRIVMDQSCLKSGSDPLYYDEEGHAVIPLGSFTVQETKAPAGYILDSTLYQYQVTSQAAGNESAYTSVVPVRTDPLFDHASGLTSEEPVILGGIKVQKQDAEQGNMPQGSATLEGAQLTIFNDSDKPVWYQGRQVNKGEAVLVLTTGADGTAQTEPDALAYGDYIVKETKAPKGYERNEEWTASVQIRENGQIVQAPAAADRVIRRDFEFLKVDIDGRPLANTPFLMTLYTDDGQPIEQHVFVTDANGWYKSAQKQKGTGANSLDSCLENGWFVKNGQHSKPDAEDAQVPVWFGAAGADYSRGALVYGTYRIEELRTTENAQRHETLQFSRDTISVTQTLPDPLFLGVMVDVEVTLSTKVRDCELGSSMTRLGEAVEVEDEVTYDHLDTENRYILRIFYKDTLTKDTIGISETEFTPESSGSRVHTTGTGRVVVKGTIDTTGYAGRGGSISAYSELYQIYTMQGQTYEMLIASHNEDLSDPNETLSIPSVATQAADALTQDHVGAYLEEDRLTDTVTITGLAPQSSYRLKALAVSNGDGGEIGSAQLDFSCGRGVQSVTKSMPEMVFDSRKLQDGSVTVHEYLYYLDEDAQGNIRELPVGQHSEPLDPEQTVWYASIDTEALSENGLHAAELSDSVHITDHVRMSSLAAGEEYVLKGIVIDAQTETVLPDEEGNEITAVREFTAGSDEEQVQLDFDFSPDRTVKEAGKPVKAVVYVTLWHKDILVGSHEEPEDEDETVILVPPPEKRYEDAEMTQETCVRENDIITYTISWNQAQFEEADVRLKDTLSDGLEYVSGTALDQDGKEAEPIVSGNVLMWHLEDMPAGSWGTITYDVRVTQQIRICPMVNNQYEISMGEEDHWKEIGYLENPGYADKEYSNEILNAQVPVMTQDTVVYDGKEIEYSLVWVNPYTEDAQAELKDTLSRGLKYQEGSASLEPAQVTENEDGTTTLYWKIQAGPHEWGKIRYTASVHSDILETASVYSVTNDFDIRLTKSGQDPEKNSWQDIRTLFNPVPHYVMEKHRLTDAPQKFRYEDRYGFQRGDEIFYETVVINDGKTDLTMDITDEFRDAQTFDTLEVSGVMGRDVRILSQNGASVRLLIRSGAQAAVYFRAEAGMRAREYLASGSEDDREDADDGYRNTVRASDIHAAYTDENGKYVELSKEGICVTDENGETQYFDVPVKDLEDRESMANTPVQVPVPELSLQKYRVDDAPAKAGSDGLFGFMRGDRIRYRVIIENSGELDAELTVSDAFAREIETCFESLKIVGIEGKELKRISDTETRILVPAQETAAVDYEATASMDAKELLSDYPSDKTGLLRMSAAPEELEKLMNDPTFDLLGYLNTAKASDITAVYRTNDGKEIRIHGPNESGMSNVTEIIYPDGTRAVLGNAGEFSKKLSDQTDAAHTSVQTPAPSFTMSKQRLTPAPEDPRKKGVYGFRPKDLAEYEVTLANTGGLDLEMTITDRFEEKADGNIEDLAITGIKGYPAGGEMKRLDAVSAQISLPAGCVVVVTYSARIKDAAQAIPAKHRFDDGTGYANTASADDIHAVWITNDGQKIRIDKDWNNGEFEQELSSREDKAYTPVQEPNDPQQPEKPEDPKTPEPMPPQEPQEPDDPQPPQPPAENPQEPPAPLDPVPAGPQDVPPVHPKTPHPSDRPGTPERIVEGNVRTGDESGFMRWLAVAAGALLLGAVSVTVLLRRRGKSKLTNSASYHIIRKN